MSTESTLVSGTTQSIGSTTSTSSATGSTPAPSSSTQQITNADLTAGILSAFTETEEEKASRLEAERLAVDTARDADAARKLRMDESVRRQEQEERERAALANAARFGGASGSTILSTEERIARENSERASLLGVTPEMAAAERERQNRAEAERNLGIIQQRSVNNRDLNDRRVTTPFNASDVFISPKIVDLKGFSYEPAQASTATVQQIEKIRVGLIELGVPAAKVTYAMWDIARCCADVGSSENSELVGTHTQAEGVTRMEIAAKIKSVCSLRRFCRFYAKIVWNIMLASNVPPSDYIAKGYKENTKFAAFDFFESVASTAALDPADGLIRKPYFEEIVAHNANKGIVLHRQAAAQDKSGSTLHEITGGRTGPRARLTLKGVAS